MIIRIIPAAFIACFALGACGGERPDGDANEDIIEPAPYGEEEGNVELWLETMEVGSRELYNAREDVLAAVGLRPGDRVADIGAGTGLYTLMMAEAVGEDGAVFAVDIEPRFLKLINQRSADLDLSNVVSVLGRQDSVTLPDQSVDVVFISDTYNYLESPGKTMSTVFDALRPGGVVFILDFDLPEGEGRAPELQHLRVGKEAVATEVETIGFRFDGEINVPGLDETYMLKFTRP